ncbi:C1 family peptidase [Phormidesmis priestleyi]
MTKKGTGWIPDYPDVKDYTLESEGIQGLVSRVRREQVTSSIEDITIKFTDALKLLATDTTRGELTKLTDEIEKRVLGDVSFKVARIHKVLKLDMFAPEVLLIKNYLQRISQKSQGLKPAIEYKSETVTDALFDQDADTAIRAFQTSQKNLLVPDGVADGVVDIDTMTALREVVSALEGGNEMLPQKWIQLSEDNPESVAELLDENYLKYFKLLGRLIAINELSNEWSGINRVTKELVMFHLGKTSISPAWNATQVFSYFTNLQSENSALINDLPQFFEELTELLSSSEKSDKGSEEVNLSSQKPEGVPKNSKEKESPIEKLKTAWSEAIKDLETLPKSLKYLSDNSPNLYVTIESKLSKEKGVKADTSSSKNQKITQSPQTKSKENDDFIKTLEQALEKNQENFEKGNAAFNSVVQQLTQIFFPIMLPKTEREEQVIPAPLPPQVFEFVREKLISQKVDDGSVDKLYQVLRPIAEAIAQIISPLGQPSNLQVALEKGFNTFERQLKQAQNPTAKPIALGNLSSIATEKTRFQDLISEAVKEVLEDISLDSDDYSDDSESGSNQDKSADSIKQNVLDNSPPSLNPIEDLRTKLNENILRRLELEEKPKSSEYCVKKRKKKLLEIIDPKPEQKGSEYLQVPLNRKLKQEIEKHKSADAQMSDDRSSEDDNKVYLFLPEFVDLSFWCSAIEDQGSLNSCTAHAGVALTEYFAKRSFGRYVDVSPLFLYKVTRDLMHRQGDAGASVRETMKAMVLFGVPPEEHWSYPEHSADDDPSPFCYSFAQTYQALKYFRLDHAGISKYALLTQIQITLVAGFPCMFGFTIYSSIYSDVNMRKGYIPYPGKADKVEGGHAVVAVGYDDSKMIDNADGRRSTGALLIRNSWGTAWGKGGYGWLPYDYVLDGLTADWWSLVKSEWFETGQFGVGASDLGDTRPGQK